MRLDVPILAYHAIGSTRSPISVTQQQLAWQMRWLRDEGYVSISLRQLAQALKMKASIPARSVIITFDDGLESVYTKALPVLRSVGFSATVFLVTGHVGGCNDWPGQPSGIPALSLMNWAQIRELVDHGFELGAHTLTHPRLDRIPHDKMVREVVESKQVIQEQLDVPVEVFAYPYGRHNAEIEAVVAHEYQAACSAKLGQTHRLKDVWQLRRIDVHYVRQPLYFRWLSHPLFSMYLGLRAPLREVASAVIGRSWA